LKVADVVFAAIDFESAGSAAGLTDEPVQIAVVHMDATGVINDALASYLKPGRPVTWSARAVHGIGDEHLAAAPRLTDLWPEVRNALGGRWIVAHGAATEKRFLRAFPLHGFGPWVDTFALARKAFPGMASYALGDIVGALGLLAEPEIAQPGFRWHDARCDAVASLVLLRHIIRAAGLGDQPATVLTA